MNGGEENYDVKKGEFDGFYSGDEEAMPLPETELAGIIEMDRSFTGDEAASNDSGSEMNDELDRRRSTMMTMESDEGSRARKGEVVHEEDLEKTI